jgi:GAF domain-containing protein
MLPRPRSPLRRLLTSHVPYNAGQTIFTALAGGGATFGLNVLGLQGWALFTGICTALATAFGIVGAGMEVRTEAGKETVHELEGCLETLLSILNPPGHPEYDKGLRATLHVAVERGASFLQVVDYVGDDRMPKTAGRRFRSTAGLAGRVLRNGSPYAASRSVANHESYVHELVTEWGYTETEARKRDMSAMSWMAVPLAHSGRLEGLLYLDSTRKAFFDDERRQVLILSAAVGIAKFSARRYTTGE